MCNIDIELVTDVHNMYVQFCMWGCGQEPYIQYCLVQNLLVNNGCSNFAVILSIHTALLVLMSATTTNM